MLLSSFAACTYLANFNYSALCLVLADMSKQRSKAYFSAFIETTASEARLAVSDKWMSMFCTSSKYFFRLEE